MFWWNSWPFISDFLSQSGELDDDPAYSSYKAKPRNSSTQKTPILGTDVNRRCDPSGNDIAASDSKNAIALTRTENAEDDDDEDSGNKLWITIKQIKE